MKLVNIPNYIDNKVINYIDEETKRVSASDFDENSFLNWLVEYDIEHKTNPSAYVKSCFKKELDNGTFRPKAKVNYLPNTQVLINEMRDRGIHILAEDSMWLSVVWKHIINFHEIDIVECQALNRKILDYLGENKSFDEYKKLLKNANTLSKLKINWKLLDSVAEMENAKWNKALDEMPFESEE